MGWSRLYLALKCRLLRLGYRGRYHAFSWIARTLALMKFRLTTILLITTILCLVAMLYQERTAHAKKLVAIEKAYQARASKLHVATDVTSKARQAIILQRFWFSDNLESCFENEMAILVADLHRYAETIDQTPEIVEIYGNSPSDLIAGGLLFQLDCGSKEYFSRYADKKQLVLQDEPFQRFVESAASHSSAWEKRSLQRPRRYPKRD